MFCKWCGNKIRITEKSCPVCGRETPPMSDCGGLYNLKQFSDAPAPVPFPDPPEPVVKQCPIMEKIEPKYVRDRKAAKAHRKMTAIGLLVIFLAIVLMAAMLIDVHRRLNGLEDILESSTSPDSTTSAEANSDETEEPLPKATAILPPDKPYAFMIEIAIHDAEVSTSHDFGAFAQNVVTKTAWNTLGEEEAFDISYNIQRDGQYAIGLSLLKEMDEAGNVTILAEYRTDLQLFQNCRAGYSWQYRNELGIWVEADQGAATPSGHSGSRISCDAAWLESIAERQQAVELQCRIQVENKDGDTMTILVNGITISLNRAEENT